MNYYNEYKYNNNYKHSIENQFLLLNFMMELLALYNHSIICDLIVAIYGYFVCE